MRRKLRTQCRIYWVVHSSAIKNVLVLLSEVRLPGAHAPNCSATDCDEFSCKGSFCRQETYCTRKSGRLFIMMSLMEKRTKFMHEHIAWTFLGDRGVQRKVRSRFRPHPRIAESEASFLEFTIKSAMKLLVKPPVTVGLSFCPATFHDVSYR